MKKNMCLFVLWQIGLLLINDLFFRQDGLFDFGEYRGIVTIAGWMVIFVAGLLSVVWKEANVPMKVLCVYSGCVLIFVLIQVLSGRGTVDMYMSYAVMQSWSDCLLSTPLVIYGVYFLAAEKWLEKIGDREFAKDFHYYYVWYLILYVVVKYHLFYFAFGYEEVFWLKLLFVMVLIVAQLLLAYLLYWLWKTKNNCEKEEH